MRYTNGKCDLLYERDLGVITEIKMVQRINESMYIQYLSKINEMKEKENYRKQKEIKGCERHENIYRQQS